MTLLKFGGTSLANATPIRHRETTATMIDRGDFIQGQDKRNLCFEALADLLEQNMASRSLNRQRQHRFMNFGDRCSTPIMAGHSSPFLSTHYLEARNISRFYLGCTKPSQSNSPSDTNLKHQRLPRFVKASQAFAKHSQSIKSRTHRRRR